VTSCSIVRSGSNGMTGWPETPGAQFSPVLTQSGIVQKARPVTYGERTKWIGTEKNDLSLPSIYSREE
jgi:hypothetical protein